MSVKPFRIPIEDSKASFEAIEAKINDQERRLTLPLERPDNPRIGTGVFNSSTNLLEIWNGTAWVGTVLS